MSSEPLARLLGRADGIGGELEAEAARLLAEEWRSGDGRRRSLSPRQLDLFYRVKPLVPRALQLAARRLLVRAQGLPEFPAWPFEPRLADLLREHAGLVLAASGARELPFPWFWPEGRGFAVVLTHDVESAEGLRHAVELADLEQERGFRSSFNVVADWYPLDRGVLDELRGRGFEIGLHGLRHDRSLFASRESFERQLPLLADAARMLGAVGFRSPATHRVLPWLAELPVEYDCTVPHSDPFEPQPGGCCSPWPFFIGDVVELPYTLPQDHTLFTLLGHRTIDVWAQQVDTLAGVHGLVQAVTHPDPGYLGEPRRRALYVELLDRLRERTDAWHALPRDVARWWRQRDAGGTAAGTIRAGATPAETLFEPSR